MRELEVRPATDVEPVTVIERACGQAGLIVTLRGTLAAYPGCVHWHLKKGRLPGTLEITWWPKAGRLWFKVAGNRDGPWIDGAAAIIRKRLKSGGPQTDS